MDMHIGNLHHKLGARSALVESIGLVLATPITTAIAVLMATAEPARRRHALVAPSGHTHAYR